MMYVLTEEYNDYNQYGEYFVDAWRHKPTKEDLLAVGVEENRVDHVLNGGGRTASGLQHDDHWFHLREHKK